MAAQYWIGGFYIDLSRNQITQNNQSQTLAPKALAVLTYLAENQGKVVSQDAILDKVWQNTAVSPNTLQKSIAQLRKALGDSGDVYIKTHSKQGYSLECDVRWHDGSLTKSGESENASTYTGDTEQPGSTEQPSSAFPKLTFLIAGILILGGLGFQFWQPKQSSTLSFDKLTSLTATDDKEFDATYTPDGQYIVFHRYLEKQCVNKLWAKNIETQQEFLLTPEWGAYGEHSFSKDGKNLVFLATGPCNQPTNQSSCYDLVSLDFAKSLESPQKPNLILQCKNSTVQKPIWLNNGDIALMQRSAFRWKLISYSPSQNLSAELYNPDDGNIIDYVYSKEDDLFAVARFHSDGNQYVELLKTDGTLLSSHPIERPQEIPQSRPLYPSFDSLNKQLVFSTGRQLFTLSYEGKVNKINLPFGERMAQPEFHPSGKRLLMLKGPYDSDIVKLSFREAEETDALFESSQHHSDQSIRYKSFERTNLGEDQGIFQPNGNLIAFWSERSGEEQLWVSDGETAPQMLTNFPTDTFVGGIDWAADGQSLLVAANGELFQVSLNESLDSAQKSIPLDFPIVRLFQWDSTNNTVLLAIRINGILKTVELNLSDLQYKLLSERFVLWAQKSDDGRIIIKDHMGHYWKPGPVEHERIDALNNQQGKAKAFVIYKNTIYSINNSNQFWSYDLNTDKFEIIREFDHSVDYLTDVNETDFLMTIQVAAKKELVELTVTD